MPPKKSHSSMYSMRKGKASQMDVSSFDLKRFSCKRIFEVGFINTASNKTKEDLNKIIDTCRKFEKLSKASFITYEDVIKLMTDFSTDPDSIKLPNDIKETLTNLCTEGMLRYKEGLPIPTNIMARLIKCKLIHTMYLQYTSQVNDMNDYKKLEEELEILSKYVPNSQSSKDKKSKKGKGKGSKEIKDSKGSKSSSDKKSPKVSAQKNNKPKLPTPTIEKPSENIDYTTIPLSENPLIRIRSFDDEIWFYCFSEFYDAQLMPVLVKINVPVSFIVEVSSFSSSEDQEDLEVDDSIANFWYKTDMLLYGHMRQEELENTILMKYAIIDTQDDETEDNNARKDMKNGGRKNLQELLDVLKSIHNLQLTHLNYIENLKLCTLDRYGHKIIQHPIDFQLYNQFLDEFPIECLNVPIILESLLEEVCLNYEGSSGSGSLLLQDTHFDDNNHVVEDYCFCPFSFDYFIPNKKNIPVGIQKTLLEDKQKIVDEKTTHANDKTFQIHENNFLEQIMRSYKEIGRKVYDITLKYLKNSLPALLVTNYDADEAVDFKHTHDRADISCNIPNLSDEEIFHYITSLLLFRLHCHQSLPCENEICDTNINLKMKELVEDYKNAQPEKIIEDDTLPYSKSVHIKTCDKNLYELRIIANYNWSEILPQCVLLQEISDSNDQYSCTDSIYCNELKSLLVRFHNDLDDFGINTRIWNESLRTPVCFRDFCRYVCREDVSWLIKHQNDLNVSVTSLSQKDEIVNKDIEATSLLAAYNDYLQYISSECDTGSRFLKSISSQEMLAKVVNYPKNSNTLKEHCLKSGEFYSYIAYDLGTKRIEVSGSTTVFQSNDGVKIKVDTTHFLGCDKNLSIVVSSENNDLILHRNGASFLLRYVTSDGTIIILDKPLQEIEIQQSKSEVGDLLSETFATINTHETLSVESSLIKEEQLLSSFTSLSSPPGSRKVKDSDTLLFHNTRPSKTSHSRVFSSSQKLTETKQKDLFAKHFFKVPNLHHLQEGDELKDFASSLENHRVRAASDEILHAVITGIENDISLYKINAKDNQKLLWGKPEDLKIPIFTIIKRLLYKHAKKEKCKKYFRKYVPKNRDDHEQTSVSSNQTDLKTTLPNGLTVTLVPSKIFQGYTEVRQKYLSGTHPKHVKYESYRLFTRNGMILIRYPDGRIDLLKSNGEIVQFEQPGNNEQSVIDVKFGSEVRNCFKLPSCKNLYNCQKQIADFMVEKYGEECSNFVSRRANLHKQKASAGEFPTELSGFTMPYLKYSTLKFDGQRVVISKDQMTQKYECFMTHEFDHRLEECFYIRDDGLRCLLQRDRKLCIQFPDKSRITSWFDIEPELIYIDKKTEGWVSVILNFQFEHPNYASVIYKASSDSFDVIFNDQLTIKKSEDNFEIKVCENLVTSLQENEVKFTKTCPECESIYACNINIGKFTNSNYNKDTDILVAKDSYNKIFRVHDIEKYSTNKNFLKGPLNHRKCDHYSAMINEKLFAIRSDYSGLLLWNNRNIESKMKHFEKDPKAEVVTSTNFYGIKCIEFLRKIHQRYNKRFTNFNLIHNNLCLSRYVQSELKSPELACLSYREIYEFGSLEKLQNIIMEITDYIENSGKISILPEGLLEITTLFLQNVNDKEFMNMFEISSSTSEEIDDRLICDCMKLKFTYQEKIEYWRDQCQRYKKLIKTSFVPLYFFSEYYHYSCNKDAK